MRVSAPSPDLAADVDRGLRAQPKRLPPKYFYDALGSTLFDAITHLPWYRISRAEHRLLAQHAPAIADALTRAGAPAVTLVELGCGAGDKTARVAAAVAAAGLPGDVHLVDMSRSALRAARRQLRRFRNLTIETHATPYEEGLSRVSRWRRHTGPLLVLFLGSNIGNFEPPAAVQFLSDVREVLAPGDLLLLGVDLVKPEADLLLAYDDPLGVTSAFNKNLLVRINRELDAAFDLTAFDHQVVWNEPARRIEMHLVSRCAQRVAIRALDWVADFEAGESIWTESSYKYERDEASAMGAIAGFAVAHQWIDDPAQFALTLFSAQKPRYSRKRTQSISRGVSTIRRRAVSTDNWGKPERNDAGQPICRWCRGPVIKPRRTFCSDTCVHEWRVRSSPSYVRKEIKKRDKGVCQLCGFDVRAAERTWRQQKPLGTDRRARKLWRAAKPRWEADHILPVADGGGECGLDNYRLLCRTCHVAITLSWRKQREWSAARAATARAGTGSSLEGVPQARPFELAENLRGEMRRGHHAGERPEAKNPTS